MSALVVDGRPIVVSGGNDGAVRLWDAGTTAVTCGPHLPSGQTAPGQGQIGVVVSDRPGRVSEPLSRTSVSFWCSSATTSRVQWNVAGYSNFTTVAGTDDKTEDAFGAVVEFIFYDQDGNQLVPKPVNVSVGHPQKVSLNLDGVVNLRMTCSSRDAKTDDSRSTRSSLGDPVVTQ